MGEQEESYYKDKLSAVKRKMHFEASYFNTASFPFFKIHKFKRYYKLLIPNCLMTLVFVEIYFPHFK